jgi:hypothetical protein
MMRWQLLVCALLSVACGDKPRAEPAQPAPAPVATPAKPAEPEKPKADFSGVIRGIVKLAPGKQLPLARKLADVVNAVAPCPAYNDVDRKVMDMAEATHGLSPVHVALTDMKEVPEHAPATVELRIEDCRLRPTLIGVMVGDEIKVQNASQVPFLPLLPGDKYNQGILKGQSRSAKMTGYGTTQILCNVAGYCGATTVIGLQHPLFAVTDKAGEFEIKGVPVGEQLTIHAWHPLFDVSSQPVTVSKDAPMATVELLLTPLEQEPEPKPEPKRKSKKDKGPTVL